VKLYRQHAFLAHGVHQAIQAVDHNNAPTVLFHTASNPVNEFAGRQFSRIALFQIESAPLQMTLDIQPESTVAIRERLLCLVKRKDRRLFALPLCRRIAHTASI